MNLLKKQWREKEKNRKKEKKEQESTSVINRAPPIFLPSSRWGTPSPGSHLPPILRNSIMNTHARGNGINRKKMVFK